MRGWITVVVLGGCGFRIPSGEAPADGDVPVDGTADDALVDASPPDAWSADDCPGGYASLGNEPSRYRLLSSAGSVFAHARTCGQDGTHLVVLDTAAEASAVRTLINGTSGLPEAKIGGVFVYTGGLQVISIAGVPLPGANWIWATGPMTFTSWATGEPNDGQNVENAEEQVAMIWRMRTTLADMDFDEESAALCECDGLTVTQDYKNALQVYEAAKKKE